MLNATVEGALNEQIKNELYSAYLYLAMAAYFESINLGGFANWMRQQAREEQGHAMKLYDYIHERDGRVMLQALDQPPAEFGTAIEAFQAALEHERLVTGMINDLYALAVQENDYPTQVMLQWFITEQVEEEKSAGDIVTQLEMIGDERASLFILDRRLGARAE